MDQSELGAGRGSELEVLALDQSPVWGAGLERWRSDMQRGEGQVLEVEQPPQGLTVQLDLSLALIPSSAAPARLQLFCSQGLYPTRSGLCA
ncbi:hypothetical protein AAFF_G00286010 [Aldrovandia affinis]|uniref:Uncharacterized protein n=1 Tax=Aldrovandia affinis TaxID=143900 RepID=A0AAD7X2T4_9TELE|nr:hypothetical protein AAFF_G00286010 [Aldrovandia affinis]